MGSKRPGARRENPKAKQRRAERHNNSGWNDTHDNPLAFYNAKFESYYRGHIVKEEDWAAFMEKMKDYLPVNFRISTIGGRHDYILDHLKGTCFGLPETPEEAEVDGEKVIVQRPTPLPWYTPIGHAWQINLGKRGLKKIPILQKFRQFLMREDKQGNITRQEAVSMIPPQLLGVEPHHIVLDMCAAPGSKTAQLLEDLHKEGPSKVPTGIVIANDADADRAYMLVHQLKRLGSPAFLVSTHQGQFFPNLYLPKGSTHASDVLAYEEDKVNMKQLSKAENDSVSLSTPEIDLANFSTPNTSTVDASAVPSPLLFDRILCDVPCSGDGTMRKCPNIWRNWNVANAQGLHPLQLSIAWRAAQMLKVGGKMVYSTCSLNPIENEAVVAELIRRSRGALRVVDVSDKLPGLIREEGMLDWKVLLESADYTNDPEGLKAYHQKLADQGITPNENGYLPSAHMIDINNLTAMQDLSFMRRKKIRPSFFSPQLLKDFSEQTQEMWDKNISEDNNKNMESDSFKPGSPVYAHMPTAKEMGLDKCIRILPHRQDTGGFFITLIEKVDVLPTWDKDGTLEERNEKKNEEKKEEVVVEAVEAPVEETEAGKTDTTEEAVKKPIKERKPKPEKKVQQKQWNDFPFVNLIPQLCNNLQKEFALCTDKGYKEKNLFCRSDNLLGTGKKVYYLSDTISDIVNTPQNFRLKIVHSGLKVFEATGSAYDKAKKKNAAAQGLDESTIESTPDSINYRITQDALSFVLRYIGKQVLHVTAEDLTILLKSNNGARFEQLSEKTRKILECVPDFVEGDDGEDKDAEVIDGVVHSSKIYLGSCVIRVVGELPAGILADHILCAAWRTGSSIALMIDNAERTSLLSYFAPVEEEVDEVVEETDKPAEE